MVDEKLLDKAIYQLTKALLALNYASNSDPANQRLGNIIEEVHTQYGKALELHHDLFPESWEKDN